jgi:hypothetical protein
MSIKKWELIAFTSIWVSVVLTVYESGYLPSLEPYLYKID